MEQLLKIKSICFIINKNDLFIRKNVIFKFLIFFYYSIKKKFKNDYNNESH